MREGLTKHEVKERVVAATRETPTAPRERAEYSNPLIRYIAAHKSLAVQAALLAYPRAAKEIAVIQMMRGSDTISRVTLEPHPCLSAFERDVTKPRALELLEKHARAFQQKLDLSETDSTGGQPAWEWLVLEDKDPLALYEAVKALSDADLDELHILLAVLCFGQGNSDQQIGRAHV